MVSDAVFQQVFEVVLPFIVIAFAYYMDGMTKKVIWRPVFFFMDVPISLAVGVELLGNATWSSIWFMGIFMFLFAILLSIGGLWLSLSFGKAEG